MRKFLIVLTIFSSISFARKDLKYKFFVNGKTYIITDKDYTEIPFKHSNGQSIPFKLKAIKTELDNDKNLFEFSCDKKYNITFNKFYNFKKNFTHSRNYSIALGKITTNFDILDINNDSFLKPTLNDNNIDLLKSSISDLDNRKANIIKLNNKYSLWGRYSLEYNQTRFKNFLKTKFTKNVGLEYMILSKKTNTFYKKSIIQTLNIGIDKISSDNSLNGVYLTFGLENAKDFRFEKYETSNKLEVVKSSDGFYIADTVATMFGVGINRTKKFNNGIYYDALAQITTFNRKMTSHDLQFANSRSYAISTSLETGIKVNINKDFSITPQVQQVYHYYHQNKFTNSVDTTMPKINEHIFNTRIGLKASYKNVYGKINTYLDYNKSINNVSVEGELGFDKKIKDKFNLHSSISYRQEVYNKEFKTDTNNKKVKLNLGISY